MVEIYYMEDDESIGGIVRDYFAGKGYRVGLFRTLAETRSALETRLPDIVLLDWNMPDGNGDRLCRWIRSRWEELPLIFLTVRDDASDIVSGFSEGADDYVVKPFELEVLHSRVTALLRRAKNVRSRYLSCGGITVDREKDGGFLPGRRGAAYAGGIPASFIPAAEQGQDSYQRAAAFSGLGQQRKVCERQYPDGNDAQTAG